MAGDVMNPIPFLTAEERAYHLNRRADLNEQYIHEYEQQLLNISQRCETASDNFSMLNNPPSDYVKADITTAPVIETVHSQPPARCTPKVSSFDRVEKESPSTLRVCSWNICGLRSNIQKGGFDYLLKESPDIIALQETKCPGDKRPKRARLLHYYVKFSDNVVNRGYSGVALYSKVKPLAVLTDVGDQEARRMSTNMRGIRIFLCYMRIYANSGRNARKITQAIKMG